MGRTIFFASWGLVWWVGGGGEVVVVGGFLFDSGGGAWDGSAEGCCWFGFGIEEGEEDILMGNWEE